MGITQTLVVLRNPAARERCVEVEMIVDSGAIFSVVPAAALRRIGVVPESTETFALADGRPVRREIGNVLYEVGERTRAAPVVFGRRQDACLLGAVTLEALGLRLDPLRRQLRPLKLMIA
jgi:predicted aspartyl protease